MVSDGGRGSGRATGQNLEPVDLPRKNSCKGDLGLLHVTMGFVETLACPPCPPAPNSEEEARWLAEEVSASIQFVARAQRRQSRTGLERSNPEKVATVLTEMARGMSQFRARSRFKLSGKVICRIVRDHQELLERTHAWRVETSSRLAARRHHGRLRRNWTTSWAIPRHSRGLPCGTLSSPTRSLSTSSATHLLRVPLQPGRPGSRLRMRGKRLRSRRGT